MQLMALAETSRDFLQGCNTPHTTAPSFYDQMVQREKDAANVAKVELSPTKAGTAQPSSHPHMRANVDALASVEAELDAAVRARRRVAGGKKTRAKRRQKTRQKARQHEQGEKSSDASDDADELGGGVGLSAARETACQEEGGGMRGGEGVFSCLQTARGGEGQGGKQAALLKARHLPLGEAAGSPAPAMKEVGEVAPSRFSIEKIAKSLSNSFSNLLGNLSRVSSHKDFDKSGAGSKEEELSSSTEASFEQSNPYAALASETVADAPTSRFASDFIKLECLGKGGFGKVWRARNRLDGMDYAVKSVR